MLVVIAKKANAPKNIANVTRMESSAINYVTVMIVKTAELKERYFIGGSKKLETETKNHLKSI
jgi:hypothetical protein